MNAFRMIPAVVVLAAIASTAMAVELEGFQSTYGDARDKAIEQNQPLYLHFTTQTCGWCRKIEDDIYKTEEGSEILDGFVKASLDCTTQQGMPPVGETRTNIQLLRQFGGSGFPYLVVLAPDEEILLHSFSGYRPMDAFRAEIEIARENWKKYQEFKKTQDEDDERDYEYYLRALAFYSNVGAWKQAADAAEELKQLDPEGEQGNRAEIAFAMLMDAITSRAPTAKLEELAAEVKQYDPTNEEGMMEQVYLMEAGMGYRQATRLRNEGPRREKLLEVETLLTEMIDKADTLQNEVYAHAFLAQVQQQLGKTDSAIASLEHCLETTTDEKQKTQLREDIAKLKALKASNGGSPPGGEEETQEQ